MIFIAYWITIIEKLQTVEQQKQWKSKRWQNWAAEPEDYWGELIAIGKSNILKLSGTKYSIYGWS